MVYHSDFNPSDLWRGCVLATIAHSIFIAQHIELAAEQSWDGSNYNVQDSQGSLGTVTFGEEGTVGTFFDSHSSLNPFSTEKAYELSEMLAEMPPGLRALADREALQYLLQDYKGKEVPIITATFWSENGRLVAAEPWQSVFSNGGHLVRTQLGSTEDAMPVWKSNYGFNEAEVGLLRSLFVRRVSAQTESVVLTALEKDVLLEGGSQGLELSRELFAAVSIIVP